MDLFIEFRRRLQRNWCRKKNTANRSQLYRLPGSEHKDPCMQCNPLYIRCTSWLFRNPEPPGPRQQYVLHGVQWPKAEACIMQSVILPLYSSLRFRIHVGHESLLHLDFDLASSIRYTSVILFTARWDPRGPRITLSS